MKNWAIDLGTTNSSIAWSDENKTEIIKFIDNNNEESIPTVMIAGDGGNDFPAMNRKRKLYSNNVEIYEEWKIAGMKTRELGNKPWYSSHLNTNKKSTPISLSSKMIETLIRAGEKQTGDIIREITITIPANFGEEARKNTIRAAKLFREGLKVKLAHEPTAAAVSLLVDRNISTIYNKNILVLDMGGGTTDVSIVTIDNNDGVEVDVHGTQGVDIAGKTIDGLIMKKYIMPAFSEKTGISKSVYKDSLTSMMMYDAERIKLYLAREHDDYDGSSKFQYNDKEYKINVEVEYDQFLALLDKPFKTITGKINEVLKESKLNKSDIDFVVLAGSSSKGPWVKEKINGFFGKSIVVDSMEPGSAIAKGATIIEGITKGEGIFVYKDSEIFISEKTPTFTSTVVIGLATSTLIEKNAPLPISTSKDFFVDHLENGEIIEIKLVTSTKNSYFHNEEDISFSVDFKIQDNTKPITANLSYDYSMNLTLEIINGTNKMKADNIEELQNKNRIHKPLSLPDLPERDRLMAIKTLDLLKKENPHKDFTNMSEEDLLRRAYLWYIAQSHIYGES